MKSLCGFFPNCELYENKNSAYLDNFFVKGNKIYLKLVENWRDGVFCHSSFAKHLKPKFLNINYYCYVVLASV